MLMPNDATPATAIPDAWKLGDTAGLVEVACCPRCGTTHVRSRGGRTTGARTFWWECMRCMDDSGVTRLRWKTPRDNQGFAKRV